jgi:hypothetical protein
MLETSKQEIKMKKIYTGKAYAKGHCDQAVQSVPCNHQMICAPRGLDVHADEDQEKKRQE